MSDFDIPVIYTEQVEDFSWKNEVRIVQIKKKFILEQLLDYGIILEPNITFKRKNDPLIQAWKQVLIDAEPWMIDGLASNFTTPGFILELLYSIGKLKLSLGAFHPNCPQALQIQLINLDVHEEPSLPEGIEKETKEIPFVMKETLGLEKSEVRLSAERAKNPDTPSVELERLVHHPSAYVRGSLAANPKTPPDFLLVLAKDCQSWVARLLAANPASTEEVLDTLSLHEDYDVRILVTKHLKTTSEMKDRIIRKLISEIFSFPLPEYKILGKVIQFCLDEPSIPEALLDELANSEVDGKRLITACNSRTNRLTQLKLIKDKNAMVKNHAFINLELIRKEQ